jgi:DNA processing protein
LRRAAVAWARASELTPQRLWPVVRARGGPEALLSAPESDLSEWLGSRERARAVLRAAEDASAESWIERIEHAGMRVVTAFDEEYPALLTEIPDPPFLLYARGNLERLRLPAVGIVGSRAATRYGREVAAGLSRDLSMAGVAVVSGFARGVDAAAHQAALGSAGGTIVALKEALRARDLILSEFPPGTEPRAMNFPVRNRVIAGLCAGVVVVEASRRSGSLITARLANDFGRDVFAVPGSVFSQTSLGAHELLRDGAILCRGAEDVLAELFPAIGVAQPPVPTAPDAGQSLSKEARLVLETLRKEESASAEDLAQMTELSAAVVLAALFELEEAGLASFGEGGRYGVRRN